MKLEDYGAELPRTIEECEAANANAVTAAEAYVICKARENVCVFLEYVMRDEESGQPIKLEPFHREWQQLISGNDRAIIFSSIESGKTVSICIGRVLWELGRNPSLRVLIVSNTDTQAEKIIATIARYIERSAALHKVFPELKKSERKADAWTGHALFVQRPYISKDPSVCAAGVHSTSVIGSRVDFCIGDDVMSFQIAVSVHARQLLIDWWHANITGRLTRNGRLYLVGTAWHRDDLMHHSARSNPTWAKARYPMLKRDPVTGEERSAWPGRWPLERIRERMAELGPIEAARQIKCVARSDEEARFKKAWIDAAFDRGLPRSKAHALAMLPAGYFTVTGVDLGVSRSSKSDLTVILTVVLHPNEDREVLDIQSGRWAADEIVERIIDTHRRYHSVVYVENNAAQDFLVQVTKKISSVPVKPFTTGANKHHPEYGVESIAAEFANGKWIFPCKDGKDPELILLEQALLYYQPNTHTPDHLMALWFAREGCRVIKPRKRTATFSLLAR